MCLSLYRIPRYYVKCYIVLHITANIYIIYYTRYTLVIYQHKYYNKYKIMYVLFIRSMVNYLNSCVTTDSIFKLLLLNSGTDV